jgi:hypothetical protein
MTSNSSGSSPPVRVTSIIVGQQLLAVEEKGGHPSLPITGSERLHRALPRATP